MTADVNAARDAWMEHRHFRYRGCAPDPDSPMRAAGNPELSLDAWHGPDVDGGEPQKERRAREAAAVAVCRGCPVVEACARYANTVTVDGRLAEPTGVWGGQTGSERGAVFRRRRHKVVAAAPETRFRTRQKEAVLLALAMCTDPVDVARAAGVDVRTANWQRSRIVGLLSLDKSSATRAQVLEEAVRRGLLDAAVVVADDGSVPAVPPSTAAPVPAPAAASAGTPEPAGSAVPGLAAPAAVDAPSRRRRPRRTRAAVVDGQLSFDDALAPAPVTPLFPHTVRLEAAA